MLLVSSPQRLLRLLFCLGLGLVGLPPSGLAASPVPQITQPVNQQQRIPLKGNVRPLPRQALDLGETAAATPASGLLLLLKRSPAQQADLEQFLADVHSPGSPGYRQWLTPAQFGARFGPADSDLQTVVAWLQSQCLAVDHINQARTAIEFSGSAAQIESAFATHLHSFEVDGEQHIANITDPQIPVALAPVIAGVSPLNDFRTKPLHTEPRGRIASTATQAHAIASAHATSAVPAPGPALDTGNGHYDLSPADVATVYDLPNSALNSSYGGANLTGSGVAIGIAGTSNVDLGNVAHYRKLFGLPALTPKIVIDGADPGIQGDNAVEALLDLEAASAVAPAASLTLYISQSTTFQDGLFLAIQRALDDDAVSILNVSFGQCEAYEQAGGNQEILNFWQQAAAQGISVTVSTGDSGAAGCDFSGANSAAEGLQVNAIASTPYNIAVGGTDFNQTTANEAQYWNASNAPNGESAMGYIPEIAWNNSTSTTGGLSGNIAARSMGGATNIEAAGGGVSGCFTATQDPNTGNIVSCRGGYAKPAWQSSFGSLNGRQLPDVSLFSANGGHDSAWVICASGLGADAPNEVDCVPDTAGNYKFQEIGGTSASSPAFAGVLSLVIQQIEHASASANVRLGQADYTLYPLAKQHPAAFHDVAAGNISVVCTAGTLNCGANGFLTGYDAVSGYDSATGLGSVDAAQLVQSWSNITFQPTTTSLELNGSTNPITITHGSSVNVTATVTSPGGTPTGNVALVAGTGTPANAIHGTVASPSVLTLTNGTITEPYRYLPGGSYNLTADYNGDGTFGRSVSNGISVTVKPEASTLGLFIEGFTPPNGAGTIVNSATVSNVPYGTWISVVAQPVSASLSAKAPYVSQATGKVVFTGSSPVLNQTVAIDSNDLAEIPNQAHFAYVPGNYTVSASYAGDPSFNPSTAPAQSFTVARNSVTISSTPTSATTVTVQVDPAAIGYLQNAGTALPTGTVTLMNTSGATVGTGTLGIVTTNQGNKAQALVAVTGTAASTVYSGDTNYLGLNTASPPPSFMLGPAGTTLTVPSGGSNFTSVTITPQSGFTGTVSVSCAVTGAGTPLPTCSVAQGNVSVTGAAVNDKVTVATQTVTAALRSPVNPAGSSPSQRTWYAAGGLALAGMLLFGVPGRRRAWQHTLSLMLLMAALGVAGCGGSSGSNGSSGGGGGGGTGGGGGGGGTTTTTTPPGTYTVVVTASSGSMTKTTTIAVTVQ